MDNQHDVIIIGGGPGGYSAALYCARAGLKTLVIEKLSPGGQMATTTQVDNYPGFDEGIDGFELGEKMQRGAERFGAVTEFDEVTELDLKGQPKRIITAGGEFQAKAVIIATGALPKELGVPGEAELRGGGVSYCATCDGMLFKGKTVAVAGGGNTAVADALTLSKLCEKVYIVHRRDTLRATSIYLESLQKAKNIEFVWNAIIEELLHDGKFRGLKLTDKISGKPYELLCDGVFVAIGRSPDTAFVADQIDLDEAGYIIADESTQTNIPGVFAVGDVRTKPLRQIVNAAADGATASKFAEEYIQSLEE